MEDLSRTRALHPLVAETMANEEAAAPRDRCEPLKVNWVAIRMDYETTNMSIRALARRHGLKSDFAIRRRIKEQGWERDSNAITERLIMEAMAQTSQRSAEKPPEELSCAQPFCARDDYAHKSAHKQDQEVANDYRGQPSQKDAHNGFVRATSVRTQSPSRGDRDLSTARGRAAEQERVMVEQLDAANHAREMGMAVLAKINTLMQADVRSAEFDIAGARLRAMGEGNETLASLAKMTGMLLEQAIVIERRALGMDRAGGTAQQNPMASRGGRAMSKAIKRLPRTG